MSDVHQLPDINRIEEEASDWIARLNADHVSDEVRSSFEAWRNVHPLHARTYETMSSAWRAFKATGSVVRAVSFGQSMNDAASPGELQRQWFLPVGAMAAVLLIAALSLLWVKRLPDTQFQTAIGEHASVSLPDGSSIELNSNSAVRVNYTDYRRVIQMQRGEAFYKVAHDPQRPFWVVGRGTWVRAVGTAFNVYLRAAGVRVIVSEGTVKVGETQSEARVPNEQDAAHEAASVLSAGQQVDVQGGSASIRALPPAEITRSTAWRSGKVYFEKQPLSTVVAEMGRYTTLQLIVTDDRLRQLPIGGVFAADPKGVETLISMLQDGLRLQVRRLPGRVYIEEPSSSGHE